MPVSLENNKSGVPPVATIARHYDSLDFFYRDIWGEHIHHGYWEKGHESPREAATQLSRAVLERLELKPASTLADIGCGYGGTARLAAETYGSTVVGFTISAAQKTYADRLLTSRGSVEIRMQDWAEAKLPDDSVDAVLSLESIEHMPDRAVFLRSARRALRKGGRMVVSTWVASEKVSSWSERHLLGPIATEGRQASLVTSRELVGLLMEAGFPEVKSEDVTISVRKTWIVVIRRMLLRVLTHWRYWKLVLNADASDRIFAVTSCRILAAYYSGCMRYVVVTCR